MVFAPLRRMPVGMIVGLGCQTGIEAEITVDLCGDGAILLISCYELGHQPYGVAHPLGFLKREGYLPAALDVAVEGWDRPAVQAARFIGISVPMHTALRLGLKVIQRIREVNPHCTICCYGLYASLNADYLLSQGADYCVGGESEAPMLDLVRALEAESTAMVPGVARPDQPAPPYLERLPFAVPARDTLPQLERYAHLERGGTSHVAGYTEASRGCLYGCTHCPIPPVYGRRFFVVPVETVLADIQQQVEQGAVHITFGDPDFLNGPGHALRVVDTLHREFPDLTFDFTAKVEHLLKQSDRLDQFAAAGCLFIVTAVESLSDKVLEILDKGHTRHDAVTALYRVRQAGIAPRPTWVPFTPWTTLEDFRQLMTWIESEDLIDYVDPVQYAIRLLIPPGSWLASHAASQPYLGALDEAALSYRWTHPDPRMDVLQREIARLVADDAESDVDPASTFYRVREVAAGRPRSTVASRLSSDRLRPPRLTESWFC